MTFVQKIVFRIKNLALVLQGNLSVVAAFLFALCLATLIYVMYLYGQYATSPAFSIDPATISIADLFIGIAPRLTLVGVCFTPLSIFFMLYCVKNDFLSPRIVRFRRIESFWALQVVKALLAALLFALTLTITTYVLGLVLGLPAVTFDSLEGIFFLRTKGFTIPNPPLYYLGFILFSYVFLTLSFVNLIWLLLDAILPKRWMAIAVSVALGALSIRIRTIYAFADISYTSWMPIPGTTFGFEYLIPAVVAAIAAGAIYYRIRGCPRARYIELENTRDA